jgi:hypothetical protein
MDGKKLYRIQPQFKLFFECRLLQKDPPEAEPRPAEGEKSKPKADPDAKKGEVKRKGEVARRRSKVAVEATAARAKLKPKLPTKLGVKKEEFVKSVTNRDAQNELDGLKINVLREGADGKHAPINAQIWSHSTEPGLLKIMKNLQDLEIYQSNVPFYNTMLVVLKSGIDYGRTSGDPEIVTKLQNPSKFYADIQSMTPTADFDPEAFVKAHEHLHYIQGFLLAQDKMQQLTHDKQRGADSEPISDKIGGFVKDNLRVMQKALREKDWATVGMYGVAMWTMYKAFGQLTEGEGGAKVKKWLIYGAAAYGGHLMLKNAGYDLLKMSGIRDKDYEVKGTPMEVMRNILRANPQLNEKDRDIEYGVVLQMSDVNLTRLNNLFQKTNEPGAIPQFIHPTEFPEIFDPKVIGQWPFKMGLKSNAANDQVAMGNVNLSRDQERYVELGQQLYKVALGMRTIYNDTLKVDHKNYRNVSYEEAISGSRAGARKLGKVRHLLDAVSPYATKTVSRLSLKSKDKLTGELKKIFDDFPEAGLAVFDSADSGHFPGTLKGFPVMIVQTGKDEYRVYLQNDYKGKDTPGRDFFLLKSGAGSGNVARKILGKIDSRMSGLMAMLTGAGGRSYSNLKFNSGAWEAEIDIPAAGNIGVRATKTTATIKPLPDGKGLEITAANGVRFNLDENVARQYPHAIAAIPQVVGQEEFKLLRAFHHARRIKFKDDNTSDNEFSLLIGKRNIEVKIKWNGSKYEFVNPNAEKELLKDPGFTQEYIESLSSNPDTKLSKLITKLEDDIDGSPENFFPYMWEVLTGDVYDKRLSGWNFDAFSGSVPDYFSNTIMGASHYAVLNKVRRSITGATDFKDAFQKQSAILYDYMADLEAVSAIIRDKNLDIDSWDRDDFMNEVIRPLRAAGGVSNQYVAARSDFELRAYQLDNVGLNNSDYSESSHEKAGRLMNVFSFYTSHLDGQEYQYERTIGGTTTNETFKVDLDHLDWPASAKHPGEVSGIEDPGLRGHYIIRYMKFVEGEVLAKARAGKLDSVPDPTSKAFWGIPEFEQWLEGSPSYSPLDVADEQPPYEHDPDVKHALGKPTEMEREIVKEFEAAKDHLEREYGAYLKPGAIEEYLYKAYDPANPSSTGLLMTVPKDPSVSSSSYRDFDSQLWDWGNKLKDGKRSDQRKRIKTIANDHLIRYVFENHSQFFKRKITLKASTIKKYPWIRDIKYWPDVLNPFAD